MKKAAVVVVKKDNKYLAINRNNSNQFGLIGGKVEINEYPEHAAIREAEEEAGIKIKKMSYLFSKVVPGEVSYETYCFIVESYDGEIKSSHEGEVGWVDQNVLINQSPFKEFNEIVFKEIDASNI